MNNFQSFTLLISLLSADAYTLTKLGSFRISLPAFSGFYKTTRAGNVTDRYDLIVTTFGASLFSSTDSVQIVEDIGRHLGDLGSVSPAVVTRSVTWPNEVSEIPGKVLHYNAFQS